MGYQPDDPRAKLGHALLRELGAPEASERRAGPRFLAPTLDVVIKNKVYRTIDWGLGAVLIGGYEYSHRVGAKLSITLSHAAEPEVAHRATVRVLRSDPERRRITLQFVEIGKGLLGWLGDLQMTGAT